MDPVTLIVAALVAGAAAGSKDVASSAVSESYAGLKVLLGRCFRRERVQSAAGHEAILAQHETDPNTWEKPLEKALREAGADQDEQIVTAARGLLRQADPDGQVARRYHIDLRGAAGVQTGDHNTQTNYFRR